MLYTFRRQPLKGLYLTYQLITTLLIRFPLWVILSLPRPLRPRKTWSFKRSVFVRFLRHIVTILSQTGPLMQVSNHRTITGGDGVWVKSVNELVTGDLKSWATLANVQSTDVPGYWTHRKGYPMIPIPQPEEKVLHHLHGGGYAFYSAHPKDPFARVAKWFLEVNGPVTHIFAVEYRLASAKPFNTEHPFPTQLLDALAGYNYLVNKVGIAAENVIILGDSAGGNLAHALIRYLTQDDHRVTLPSPSGALVLISPWMDMGISHESLPNGSAKTFISSDYIDTDHGVQYLRNAFTGPHGLDAAETNPYISPASLHPSLSVNFKKFPRTFLAWGSAEILYDSIRTFRDRMVADLGEGNGVMANEGKVRCHEAPDAVHDYLLFHEKQAQSTVDEINEWLR